MRNVKLGELTVSAIGLGCMSMSQSYGEANEQESQKTLHLALDSGVTFLDTANAYGNGHNEELIGRTIAARRDEYVLASKFGIVRHDDGSRGVDGRPEIIAERCEESLRRLNTEVIDLYYLHRRDPNVPIEDSVGAMADLIKAGKIRHLGLSEISAKTLRRAHAEHPITAVQSEYSLWTRDPEHHVLPTCKELGIGFVPFSPLGRAMLTGRLTQETALQEKDLRANMPRFMGDNFAKNFSLVEQLVHFAKGKNASAAQIALAWVLAQGEGIAAIPGTKHTEYLAEDIQGVDVALTTEESHFLSEIFSPNKVSGERYPPALMKAIDCD